MAILENDGNLDRATEVEGYKVLPPCVLYGKIGQGGMGAVYRGRHLNLDIDVAVKCLKPGLVGGDDQFVVRFRREARSAAQINHQNVIRVYDVAEDQGLHYLIMELVQGETARERVVRKHTLGIGEALEIVYGAAQGLAEAHRKGFIHRDIKPDNIMISSSGQVKVADLGLAKPSIRDDHASLLSGTNLVMGTPQYMPPEQWENTTTVTAAADVWALGATLYYLLVGGEAIQKDSLPRIMQRIMLQPFPDPRKQRADIPEDVAALIAKATAIAVEDRYQNAQELADAIEKLETRRSALKDKEAVSTSKVQNLVSPPPAKTLAKIKFWLDKHGQEVAGAATAAQGPGGTMVVNPGQDTVAPLTVKPNPAKWIGIAAGVVALLVVVFLLANSGRRGVFAEADRLERLGQFEAAIQEVSRVQDEDPSLPQDPVRLARLRSAWARELAVRGEFAAALVQVEHGVVARDTPEVRKQKADILVKIATSLDAKLVRETPGTQPVASEATTEFTGRIDDPLVVAVRIGGLPAPLQRGAFRVVLDTTGKNQVPVEITLTSGDVVTLQPWTVVHAGKAPVLQPAQLAVTPEVVQLEDDKEAELLIRVARGATVLVDGKPQTTTDDGTLVSHRFRSTDETPRPIVVTVRQNGFAETNKTVTVTRAAKNWTVAALEIAGARKVQGQFVTKDATVRIVGRTSERATEVLLNGNAVEARWTDGNTFELSTKLPAAGANTLRVELRKKMRPPLQQDVTVVLVPPPTIEVEPPSQANDTVSVATYKFALKVDPWTSSVSARRGGVMLGRADVPVGSTHTQLTVPLDVGANEIALEVVNVVGATASCTAKIERTAGAAVVQGTDPVPAGPPRILEVYLLIGDEEVAVPLRSARFARNGTRFRVVMSDPAATILVKDKNNPVPASDLVLTDTWPFLTRGPFVDLWARNESGTSPDVFRFGVEFDNVAPTFELTSPTSGVGTERLTCQGTCKDNQTVTKVTLNGVAAAGFPKKKGGTWSIELPGISAPVEYELAVTDIAGNVTRETVKFTP